MKDASQKEACRRWGGERLLLVAALGLMAAGAAAAEVDPAKLPPAVTNKIDFVKDIQPIFEKHCYKCHGGERVKSNFRLTNRELALKGGDQGVAVIPGNSAKSPLIHYVARVVEDMEMPPEGKGEPLTKEQVSLLRAWIDQGAKWKEGGDAAQTESKVSMTMGGTAVSGDQAKFRELQWRRDGWYGGIDRFEIQSKPDPDSQVSVFGHALPEDYSVSLEAGRSGLGFTRFGWSEFRRYYDDTGGYYAPFGTPAFSLDRNLHLDSGRAWADVGLTLPHWPRMVLGYEYQYREGSKSTLQWGPVSNGVETRNIYPGFKDISEKVHIIKFDLDHEMGGFQLSESFRGEYHDLETQRVNDTAFDTTAAVMAQTRVAERQQSWQGANTLHLEKQFTGWLFASGGYLYSKQESDAEFDSTTSNPAALDPLLPVPGWHAQGIDLERESHVFSAGSLLGPWGGFIFSLGSQFEWSRQEGLGTAGVDVSTPFDPFLFALEPEVFQSDIDQSLFRETAGVRFTKIRYTTLFAEARLAQESIGRNEAEVGGLTPYLLSTDAVSQLGEWRVGFNTSPWQRVSLAAHYRRYDKQTDYDNLSKEVSGIVYEGYPGFFRWRDVVADETEVRISLRPAAWLSTSVSYKWLAQEYESATEAVTDPLTGQPGGIAPGGGLVAGTYDSHIASLNATCTRWQRLVLSSTFSFQNARTVTSDNGSPSVEPYDGNIYSVAATGKWRAGVKTDLTATYVFSTADFSQDNSAEGLPLGAKYRQHVLQAGMRTRIGKNKSLGLQYQFSHYEEPSGGPSAQFDAHGVFVTMAWGIL